jgi:hypothetical protein
MCIYRAKVPNCSKPGGSRVFPYGVKGMQSIPLGIGLQWLQVPPSALLHHQVAGLPVLHQPRRRKLLTPLTPVAHRSWQKALQSGALPTYHCNRLSTLPSCNCNGYIPTPHMICLAHKVFSRKVCPAACDIAASIDSCMRFQHGSLHARLYCCMQG